MYLLVAYSLMAGIWAIAANFGAPHDIPVFWGNTYIGDKVVHFAIVGVFTVVLARAMWRAGWQAEISLLMSIAITMLLSSVEEASNALTPHRTCSYGDLAADFLGALTASLLAWLMEIRSVRLGWRRHNFVRPHGIPS
ncbi:hypothetical protein Pla108_28020 [Botrimarina colliarenosi]|uniref:VanZ-like domain-containing protein n=1 Tax=Botrimarina colliarenosi TaxID=2528001 RepID=A0A5C6ACX9_9BACT|nr:VanZ family protein [Botrimarina colliarenosi]TWT97025.1 hypothetical protein Pla108_28020 [Botrimarina colliarenosi]